jgi:hypothetical protein
VVLDEETLGRGFKETLLSRKGSDPSAHALSRPVWRLVQVGCRLQVAGCRL